MKSSRFKRHHHKQGIQQVAATLLFAAIVTLLLNGCWAVGPDYSRVEPDAPQKWHTQPEGGLINGRLNPETLAFWWTTLNDPELSSLEQRAVKGNLDLKNAQARILEARALRKISRAGLLPTLDAAASAKKYRTSESSGTGQENELYFAGFDAGWELDIFGGTRRAIEASQADLEATREELHDVLISLLAEVALNYMEVRTYQERLTVTKANIKSQEEICQLNRSRYQAGLVNELAVQESLRILESSRSQVPVLETGLEAAKNRLAVLLGERPGKLHQELLARKPIPLLPATVVIGVPAETLRHRPDIRRAERNLAAATARIGVATADLYPRLRLIGTIGLESIDSDDLLDWASRTWSIGPGISWNIFHGGAIRQNIKVHNARQKQALIQYESAVLKAQEEVENVLVAYAKEQRRYRSLSAATDAARQAVRLVRDQYQAGLVPFNNVLDAQRSLFSLEDELAVSNGTVTSNLVRLYKALGGGWKSLKMDSDKSQNATSRKQEATP